MGGKKETNWGCLISLVIILGAFYFWVIKPVEDAYDYSKPAVVKYPDVPRDVVDTCVGCPEKSTPMEVGMKIVGITAISFPIAVLITACFFGGLWVLWKLLFGRNIVG